LTFEQHGAHDPQMKMKLWTLLVVLACSLAMYGCPTEDDDPGGNGGDSGEAGMDGTGGSGGMAGADGGAGTGGSAGGAAGGGGAASAACGGDVACTTGSACATPIDDICGGFDNLDTGTCVDGDNRCAVACISGPCSRPVDCVSTPCTLGTDGDAFCDSEGAGVCAGRGGLRGARCIEWFQVGAFCQFVCGDGFADCDPTAF
jgi:hypothetical protein